MTHQLFVAVKSASFAPTEIGGSFQIPAVGDWGYEPIGMLEGYVLPDAASPDDFVMIEKDLAALDVKVNFGVRPVRYAHGCLGSLIMYSINVDTIEDAQSLPGFKPFGMLSGGFYPPPDLSKTGIGERDYFEGAPLKRLIAKDFYDPFILPLYKDGAYALSMIPQGQIGTIFFLENDPAHFYVSLQTALLSQKDDLERVRRFKKTFDVK